MDHKRDRLTVPYPVILNHRPRLGLVGLLLHPVRIPASGSERGEDCFPPGSWRPVTLTPLIARKDMLWRGHASQGHYQPGRRAVLEEKNLNV